MWTCPKCGKSYAKTNQSHICASADLKTLMKGNQDLIKLYEQLLERARADIGDFTIKHSHKTITWNTSVAFAIIYARKDSLEIRIFTGVNYEGIPPVYKSRKYTQKKFVNWLSIYDEEDIDKTVISLLKEALEYSEQ